MRDLNRTLVFKTRVFIAILLLGGSLGATQVGAQNCVFGEARLALEQGNAVRGFALMRMASRDGDPRAEAFLRNQDTALAAPVLPLPPSLITASTLSR